MLKNTTENNKLQADNNYAFIDAHNLYMSSQHWGWKLDYSKLRDLLRENYGVTVAYLFMGYRSENNEVYIDLQKKGYILIFKDTVQKEEEIKGNCDVDLVLHAMIDYNNYDRAVIVTGDGDFASLIRYLYQNDKLEILLVPNQSSFSNFLKRTSKEKLGYLNLLRTRLAYGDSGKRNYSKRLLPLSSSQSNSLSSTQPVISTPISPVNPNSLQKPSQSATTIHIE